MNATNESQQMAVVKATSNGPLISKEYTSQSTVLPSPIASLISLGTGTAAFSLRVGGFFTNAAIQGARVTTLTGFELGRAVIEGILLRAGQDVVDTSAGALGRAAAETLLERALTALHYSITKTSFLISTGFQLGSTSVTSTLAVSQYLLSAIDAILGDTETSKAVATIIVLVRREFQNPETGIPGEQIGLGDLIVGAVAFALLQRWGRDRTNQDCLDSGVEETVWNIVVLNEDIARLEPQNSSDDDNSPGEEEAEDLRKIRRIRRASNASRADSIDTFVNDDTASLISNASSHPYAWSGEETRSEQAFRSYLSNQLRPGTTVSVTAQSVTTNSITVEFAEESGTSPITFEPPPGYQIISFEENSGKNGHAKKVILQRRKKRVRHGSFQVDDQVELSTHQPATKRLSWTGHQLADAPGEDMQPGNLRPLTPVADNRTRPGYRLVNLDQSTPVSRQERETKHTAISPSMIPISSVYVNNDQATPTSPPPKPPRANQKRQRVPPGPNPKPSEKPEKKNTLKSSLKRGTSYKNLVDFWTGERRVGKGGLVINPPDLHTVESNRELSLESPAAQELPSFSFPSDANLLNDEKYEAAADTVNPEDSILSSLDPQMLVRSDSSVSQRGFQHARQISLTDPTYNPPLKRWKDAQRSNSRPASHRSRASLYTLPAANSETSLVLRNRDALTEVAGSLYRNGTIPGTFPRRHFLKNLYRFSRFASASYGSSFLRFMGHDTDQAVLPNDAGTILLSEHHSFSSYTRLPASTVLLSSFVDPQGGFDSKGHTETGMPLVHYIVLDHDSKAVVLTCRGTLGFEDVLTDMICDYDDIVFCGKKYQVHKGMHASARRLLSIHGSRALATIKAALEEFEDYGLVLCGHSMGGGVAALLALYLAQPNLVDPHTSAFVTSSRTHNNLSLPPNRPIHVYAYGPPATISPYLRRATRGLVTTIVHNQDVVPYLSIGTLRDAQAVALAFKVDTQDAKGEVRRRVWDGLKAAFRDKSGLSAFGGFGGTPWSQELQYDLEEEEDPWPWVALKSLRASMLSDKLCPPGEVFTVQSQPVLQRYAFVEPPSADPLAVDAAAAPKSFRPAVRATLTIVHDPERRFGELRFGSSMFADHSPARYEKALKVLQRGVCGSDI